VTISVTFAPAHIKWNSVKCSNCMSCAVVCSERHTGTSAPSRAHIRILVDLLGNHAVTAQYCRQCHAGRAPCAEVCPDEAISFDEQIRAWRVDETLCQACGLCVDVCLYDAIRIDPVTNIAAKCDLCLGTARCVEICPTQALVLVEA
jgi:Fe-S-cluster-containing hydrogenase component 2